MEIIQRIENPFPGKDDLEGRLNAVANIANNPLKIATLLHLDDAPIDGNEILKRIRKTVGEGVRLTNGRNFSGYCNSSLLDIGAVAEEHVIRETTEQVFIGYTITEAGKTFGVPIGVHLLKWGVENDKNMYSILGSTHSKGKTRSPLNRIKILKVLREKGSLREADLLEQTGLGIQSFVSHIDALKKIGFVSYSAVPEACKRTGMFTYRLTGKQGVPKAVKGQVSLTREVYGTISRLGESDNNTIAGELSCSDPSRVSVVLSGLEKQRFLVINSDFNRVLMSRAEIQDSGKKFVDECLYALEDALSEGTSLGKLSSRTEEFLAGDKMGNYLSRGILQHWMVSSQGNRHTREESNELIINYLTERPGSRLKDIAEILGSGTAYHLYRLVRLGTVRKETDKNNKKAVQYYLI